MSLNPRKFIYQIQITSKHCMLFFVIFFHSFFHRNSSKFDLRNNKLYNLINLDIQNIYCNNKIHSFIHLFVYLFTYLKLHKSNTKKLHANNFPAGKYWSPQDVPLQRPQDVPLRSYLNVPRISRSDVLETSQYDVQGMSWNDVQTTS